MTNYLIDLFCGIGGVSTGFANAGFTILAGVDFWDKALMVHESNHPTAKHVNIALGTPASKKKLLGLIPKLNANDHLHIHASPPCQNLSSINTKRNKDIGLSLTYWTLKFLMDVSMANPQISWSVEQVPNKELVDTVNGADYGFFCRILPLSEYGVPQTRTRLIISNLPLVLKPKKAPTLKTMISVPRGAKYLSGASYNRDKHLAGTSFASVKPITSTTISYTIVSLPLSFLDEKKHVIRKMTENEALILQGFPAKYLDNCPEAELTKLDRFTMIANSVPVQFSTLLAKTIKRLNE